MKGTLHKTEQGWMVATAFITTSPSGTTFLSGKELSLHPDDIKQIEEDSKIFDNIEARISAYADVEFEIIEECNNHDHFGKDCSCKTNFISYAKLKQK